MKVRTSLKQIGPGIIVAATGLGAGDIVAAAVAGARFGTVLLWAVLIGGLLKFVLNEGLARWQLVTGKTLLEGWIDYLPKFIGWYFLVYLLLWSFMVAAALMAATGLAAHAMLPQLSVPVWGVLHALVALVIVLTGGYRHLELAMKLFVGMMFVTVVLCAVLLTPSLKEIATGLFVPRLPDNSLAYVFGIIGGVGGSVTVMSYGYWMREAGWRDASKIGGMRVDLGVAYALTVLFGIAIIIVSANVGAEEASGNGMALAVAENMEEVLGPVGLWLFLLGFWGAVTSSMIGVWHGVPYLFANFYYKRFARVREAIHENESYHYSPAYRYYLLLMAVLPMLMLIVDRPVWVVVIYAVTGAFFMPLLAALLLYMNSRRQWLREYVNRWWTAVLLTSCLLLFGFLLVNELIGL